MKTLDGCAYGVLLILAMLAVIYPTMMLTGAMVRAQTPIAQTTPAPLELDTPETRPMVGAPREYLQPTNPLPAPLELLCQRIEAQGLAAPKWKRDLLSKIRARAIGKRRLRVTAYSPDDIDPQGGGIWGAWPEYRKAHGQSIRLHEGHCAVGQYAKAYPYGTILFCPDATEHLLVVVDCGPAVRGNQIDVCYPVAADYLAACARGIDGSRHDCWKLGRITPEEAR